MKIILASTSPFRKEQLIQLGLKFKAVAPLFEEESFKMNSDLGAEQLCRLLGQKKCESLIDLHKEDLIIGSDQMLVLEDKILNKPKNLNEVTQRLTELNGKTHTLLTSLFVYTAKKNFEHLDKTTLKMKNLSPEQIKDYAELDRPIGCAGGYKFEKNGKNLFEQVISRDPSSIVGLPTLALKDIIKENERDQ